MTNSYVCHDAGEAVLIDASTHTQAEQETVVRYIEENNLTVRHLLLTHAHIDHIFGCAFFAERYAKGWQMHRADVPFIDRAEDQAVAFGIGLERPPQPQQFLEEGNLISFGRTELRVLHTPGHSPGSVCFYDEQEGAVLSGDVLFQGSIGRTDLPQGSMPQLMQSISEKLLPLGDETQVYP
ncbi:MAG: MBL fold metallo-hydrolase, partial [Rhodothermales bacterium]